MRVLHARRARTRLTMKEFSMEGLVVKFLASYDAPAMDAIWRGHSSTFRRFWSERVLLGTGPIPDDECDTIIQILDRHGKGNTRDSQAVAKVMVPQGAWRRMLNSIHADRDLSSVIDSIFKEEDPSRRAARVDELYRLNEGKKNRLTGKSGNVVNALIAAHDPINNMTVISLKDRKAQIDFLGSVVPFDWENSSVGQRIVQSNLILREGTRGLGIEGSARTLSCFWYFEPVKALWKQEHTVKRTDKAVTVTVPEDAEVDEGVEPNEGQKDEIRESLQMQAILAEIGTKMGFRIWLPKSDRARILTKWTPESGELLDELPLSYDQTTMKTIEQIDVIWLKRRSIARAFEVEHTTSVYSGLLRMADLIALQPNLNIKLHIVAPGSRREKVLQEIRRPVFSLLEGRALSEICTYLSYDTVLELREQKHLEHLSDHVLEDYEEQAGEGD
jgi:hypothetical protein